MGIVDDGYDPYMVDSDGKKHFPTPRDASINGEQLFQFNPDTGILELSADDACIEKLVEACGGYPIQELVLTVNPIGRHHFQHVSVIKSLPRKDGSFFINMS